tara:strand:+ start:29 stop:715 length:687 start_codon:yes stop_codon:yes gene_type:complete
MKKIVISAIIFVMTGFSAFADKTNVGIKITQANMEASGSHTTDAAASNKGGAAVKSSGDADFLMGSLFIERQFEDVQNNLDVALGLDIVPFTAEIDRIGGNDGVDATVEIGNLVTAYVQPMFQAGDATLFLKLGYAQADLDVTDIRRQAGSAGQTNDVQSTDTSTSKSLEGPMYGAGVQFAMGSVLDVIRLEATLHEFDTISHTNSNGKIVKADAELMQLSVSFVKSF